MPTFPTPTAITVRSGLSVISDVRLVASERTDTVVTIRPRDAAKSGDQKTAEAITVDFEDGKLTLSSPSRRRSMSLFGVSGAAEVEILVPSGSHFESASPLGEVFVSGPVGICSVKTAMGSIRLESARQADLKTSFGDITAASVAGATSVASSSGTIRLGSLGAQAEVSCSNGNISIDRAGGPLRVKTANGDVNIKQSTDDVAVKNSHGNIHVEEAVSGTLTLQTATGGISVGVPAGTVAWIDLNSQHGRVRSSLPQSPDASSAADPLRIHARTTWGDIYIERSIPASI
ncbi:DUF4097 domain-containing protein [Paeniglutamicibacter sp. NPDC012692]|uniref:DUF4097 family beta strand repeat-containing protein n=1 Tax=Paeniglutamicibacter sp. NPDC012692 TaxID=3364388 RepID=UPI0036922F6A